MNHIATHREQRRREDAQGYRIFAGCSAALVVIGAVLILNQAPTRDAATGCLRSTSPALHTTALIDRTDPWSDAGGILLRSAITGLADATRPEDRLTLIPFDGRADVVPATIFDRCRPVEGKDVNAALVTPAKADKRFATTFAVPLAASLDLLTRSASAPETMLVDFLATVAGTLKYQPRGERTQLRVYSDMAENTAAGSFLPGRRRQFDPASFTTYFKERIGDRLTTIELEIVVLPSPSTPPAVARRIKAAWTAALSAGRVAFTWRQL